MKFEETDQFKNDAEKLAQKHKGSLEVALEKFCRAVETYHDQLGSPLNWPHTDVVDSGGKHCHYLKTRLHIPKASKQAFRIIYAYYPKGEGIAEFLEVFFKKGNSTHNQERIDAHKRRAK